MSSGPWEQNCFLTKCSCPDNGHLSGSTHGLSLDCRRGTYFTYQSKRGEKRTREGQKKRKYPRLAQVVLQEVNRSKLSICCVYRGHSVVFWAERRSKKERFPRMKRVIKSGKRWERHISDRLYSSVWAHIKRLKRMSWSRSQVVLWFPRVKTYPEEDMPLNSASNSYALHTHYSITPPNTPSLIKLEMNWA